MVNKTVFGRIMLRLQSPEKRLLSSKNLHRTCWVLGQAQQTTGVADQPRSDELADQSRQVRCNGDHTIPEVLSELGAIGGDGDDLVTESVYVCNVGI